MDVIEIKGANRYENPTKIRKACRGIVLDGEKILLTYEVNTDQWFIPGGGVENHESLEECCIRELAEETGYTVKVGNCFLNIQEYYEEWLYDSFYFVCELNGVTERKLTDRETEVGLEPRWISLQEAVYIFSKHETYSHVDEMKRGAYLREFQALSSFLMLDKDTV